MDSRTNAEDCLGWAATDPSGVLSPYKFSRRPIGSDDVSIKITHCGVCYADVIWSRNMHGDSMYPLVPGHEIAGVVREVGSNVQRFKVGDQVGVGTYVSTCRDCEYCNDGFEVQCEKGAVSTFNGIDVDGTVTKGGYSSFIVVHERYCFKIPNNYPLASAAPLLCAGITVYTPMVRHNMNQPGKSLGVIGLGGLGHMAVKFGKAFGLNVTVFSTSIYGDWLCPNPSCGNLNFARRVECNKCGASSLVGSGDRGGGGGYGGSRGGRGDGIRGGYDSGRSNNYGGRGGNYDNRSGGGRSGSYGGSQGGEDGGYGHAPPQAPSSYSGSAGGSYPPPSNAYDGSTNYGMDSVPPPTSYTGGPTSYPPSYGGPAGGYGGEGLSDARTGGRGGHPGGYDGGYGSGGPRQQGGGYGGPTDSHVKIKQCDDYCGDSCDNTRIYISNLPPDVTIEELRDLFGGIGQVGRIKQKRGYKDQWPWNIKIYTDEKGNPKGDAVLTYEDPQAAHSAGGFFNNHVIRGHTISVTMAEKTAPKAYDHGGRGGRGGGGERRRDNHRDGGSGPDRHHYGGNRSRPY